MDAALAQALAGCRPLSVADCDAPLLIWSVMLARIEGLSNDVRPPGTSAHCQHTAHAGHEQLTPAARPLAPCTCSHMTRVRMHGGPSCMAPCGQTVPLLMRAVFPCRNTLVTKHAALRHCPLRYIASQGPARSRSPLRICLSTLNGGTLG